MDVWVEGHQITEGLHVQDEGRLTVRVHGLEARLQQSGDQAAELTEMLQGRRRLEIQELFIRVLD